MHKGFSSSGNQQESSRNSVSEIFQKMSYNESGKEDFSSILTWLGKKQDTLSSVVNGTSLVATTEGVRGKFSIGEKVVNVPQLDGKRLESILEKLQEGKNNQTSLETPSTASPDSPRDEKERLAKFEGLMKTITGDLCKAESIAHQIPLPQIQTYDQTTWNLSEIMTSSSSSSSSSSYSSLRRTIQTQIQEDGSVHIVWRLKRADYSLRDLLSLLTPAVVFSRSSSKISLVLSLPASSSPKGDDGADYACVLPPAFLVDALNTAGILANPIDLLITTEPPSVLNVILRKLSPILWCGDAENISNVSARILAGGFKQITKAVHFIVDSSADVGSAVESIAAETWTSGSKVRNRARSLLFVHQPTYAETVERLTEKIKSFRTSAHVIQKSVDFIMIPGTRGGEKVLARTFPEDGDFSGPTLLSEIGTSNELIAMPQPGRGHILCVIPFRSVTELASLMGSLGDDAVTSVYSSNCDTLKKLVLSLRGSEIRVNSAASSSQQFPLLPNINNWALLSQQQEEEKVAAAAAAQPPKTTVNAPIDEFVGRAEKAVKAWASVSLDDRLALAKRVLNNSTLNKEQAYSYLIDLMKLVAATTTNATTTTTTIGGGESSLMTISRTKPIGVVAIVITHPEDPKITTTFMSSVLLPILAATSTGNAPIVISVSGQIPESIVASIQSVFPPGLVNFTSCSTVKDSLTRLISTGKVSTASVLLPIINDKGGEKLNEIPFKDFTNLSLFNVSQFPTNPLSPQSLTISKLVHW